VTWKEKLHPILIPNVIRARLLNWNYEQKVEEFLDCAEYMITPPGIFHRLQWLIKSILVTTNS
jgi:hypothetical protein